MRPRPTLPVLLLLLAAAPLPAPAAPPQTGAPPQAGASPQTKADAQATIWAKEQEIYRARGRGDMGPYMAGVATDYLAWPPFRDTPAGRENLQSLQKTMVTDNKEVLAMEYVAFSLNGDAAVIYYRTHRTRLPNGAAVDERFEVTHSWVRQDGTWKVLGGMARATPKR